MRMEIKEKYLTKRLKKKSADPRYLWSAPQSRREDARRF